MAEKTKHHRGGNVLAEKASLINRVNQIYRDDLGAICSCWNWREADRTKLTETTTDAFLCIEALPPADESSLRAAAEELTELIEGKLGGTAAVELVDRTNREARFA